MTTVLISRNVPTDSCHNLAAMMPRCTKTSFLVTPHYICAHRNSDNLHNAAFIGYSLVMANEHLTSSSGRDGHWLCCLPAQNVSLDDLGPASVSSHLTSPTSRTERTVRCLSVRCDVSLPAPQTYKVNDRGCFSSPCPSANICPASGNALWDIFGACAVTISVSVSASIGVETLCCLG